MMDCIVPGGVARRSATGDARAARRARRVRSPTRCDGLRGIFDEHSGLQDRFLTAGRVTPELARAWASPVSPGAASGQAHDLRVDHPDRSLRRR